MCYVTMHSIGVDTDPQTCEIKEPEKRGTKKMYIKVDHDTGQTCFDAVKAKLDHMHPGDHITIEGMAMGERVIHAEVVKALIHAAREDLSRNFRTQLEPIGDGWSLVLIVVCTGYA